MNFLIWEKENKTTEMEKQKIKNKSTRCMSLVQKYI